MSLSLKLRRSVVEPFCLRLRNPPLSEELADGRTPALTCVSRVGEGAWGLPLGRFLQSLLPHCLLCFLDVRWRGGPPGPRLLPGFAAGPPGPQLTRIAPCGPSPGSLDANSAWLSIRLWIKERLYLSRALLRHMHHSHMVTEGQ